MSIGAEGGERTRREATTIGRRDFLLGAGSGLFLAGEATAQNPPARGTAIVIGVNKPGNLPILNAAVSGAKEMATWLTAQGYEAVKVLSDEAGPVRASDVFDAISAVIDKGIYGRLVVYFAGHGCINRDTEFWLLSGAPRNGNEAINVSGSAYLARLSSLTNVVFISDACRSPPADLAMNNVSGYNIFPNVGMARARAAYVDQFLATQLGSVASEVSTDERARLFSGLYTQSFLSAFANTPADFVKTLDGSEVVLNRDLQRYLESDLPRRAFAMSLKQMPDAQITSPDATYLGRVRRTAPVPADTSTPPPLTTRRFSAKAFRSALDRTTLDLNETTRRFGRSSGYFEVHDAVLDAASAADAFDASTGFVVVGSGVGRVATTSGARGMLDRGPTGSGTTFVTVQTGDAMDVSVLIRFEDGAGIVVAALRGYVGTVTVVDGGVVNLSYAPAAKGGRGVPDESSRRQVARLQANAAAASRLRSFRVDGPEEAGRLAEAIRVARGIDPTLGLYAVYAYEQASRFEEMRSIADLMRSDLGQVLFDVAMIGGREAVQTDGPGGIVTPFCPLLARGWNYLAATRATIPKYAAAAGNYLRPALWTTFDPRGVDILLDGPLFGMPRP